LPSTPACSWRRLNTRGADRPAIPASPSGPTPRNGSDRRRRGTERGCSSARSDREDEPLYGPFFAAVTPQDLRLRFFAPVKEFGHRFIARLTQIDYSRAMALVAIDEATGSMLGVIRLHSDANYDSGEYAVLVRSDLKGRGLGYLLMQMIIEYAHAEGLKVIEGQVLGENTAMLAMCRELGFDIAPDPGDPDTLTVKLVLGNPYAVA
jgi:acetyltransferase